MTEKLYYQDPRLQRFQARLLRLERRGRSPVAVLDRSAFYPQGGGQPADGGTLNGVAVLDVQEEQGEILHFLAEPIGKEAAGLPVEGLIDFARRYEYMQQHTGQHIVSASLIRAAGFPTVSAWLGESYTAVEIDTDTIREEQIEAAAELANLTVNRNLPVRTFWIHPEEADRYALRRPPPQVERLRIVQIGAADTAAADTAAADTAAADTAVADTAAVDTAAADTAAVDTVACAGLHVAATGEVGLIKFDGLEKIRGRLRLHWLIAERAFRDLRQKDRLVAALNLELTCGTPDVLPSVRELKTRLKDRELEVASLQRRLAAAMAGDLCGRAESTGGVRLVAEVFADEDPSLLQKVFQTLLARSRTAACLVGRRGPELRWWVGSSEGLDLPWQEIVPPLLELIEGKGGGRGAVWQGSGSRPGGAERFLAELKRSVRQRLEAAGADCG